MLDVFNYSNQTLVHFEANQKGEGITGMEQSALD